MLFIASSTLISHVCG